MRHYLSLLVCLTWSSTASAAVGVRFDCYASAGPVECQSLRRAYFSALPYLRDARDEDAQVSIEVRSYELDRYFRYVVKFSGLGTAPSFTMEDDIPKELSAVGALLRIGSVLQRGTAPFLASDAPASTTDGTTVLMLRDPSGAAPGSPASTTGWYLSLRATFNVSATSSFLTSLHESAELNYSNPDWRFNLQPVLAVQRVEVDVPGADTQVSTSRYYGVDSFVARSFATNFSVAALGAARQDKSNNLRAQTEASVGIEWDLVPFLTTEDHSLGAYYQLGLASDWYVAPNVLHESDMQYAVHALGATMTRHFSSTDLSGTVSARSPLTLPKYSSLAATLGFTWRIDSYFAFILTGETAYRKALLNEPAEVVVGSAFEQYVAGGNFRPWTYSVLGTFEVSLGNNGLARADQRWRH